MPDKPINPKDEKLLKEIRERRDLAWTAWQDIQKEATEDMKYVAGDPWDKGTRAARKAAGRPTLSLDELGQYFNQVINDVRANPRAVKFSPVGDGANDEAAEFYQDKMREIEYRSNAQIAYTTALQNALHRGYGWVRVTSRYSDVVGQRFNQELWVEDIPNPDMVLPDPESKRPDHSDMRFCFVSERWTHDEFRRKYPEADLRSFSDYAQDSAVANTWIQEKTLTLAEYWCIKTRERELVQFLTPDQQLVEVFADDKEAFRTLPKGSRPQQSRKVDDPSVHMYKTNGVEILDHTEWPGKYIPITSCLGMVLYLNEGAGATRKILSMTRLARDPYMLYCYYRTSEAELVGMTPKFPYFIYRGQLSADEHQLLMKSLHEPVAVIQVEPTVEGAPPGTILPPPQRQPYEPPIQALELGAESARRAIQSAMGVAFLPTQAQRQNEKSGKALQKIQETAQRGSYHFIDNFDHMIRHIGVIVEDLMDHIYDTTREVGIRQADDEAKVVRINDPSTDESVSTKGDYSVTVSTGPASDSQRETANEFVDTLVSNIGVVAQLAGPPIASAILGKSIRLKNLGPIGDQIADLITPEQYKSQNGQVDLPALQQMVMQLQEQNQMLAKELEQRVRQIETDMVKAQSELERERLRQEAETARALQKLASDREIAFREMEIKLQIEMAKLGSAESMARAEAEQEMLHQHGEAQMQREAQMAQSAEKQMDRQSERDQAAESRMFEADQAERSRQAEADRAALGE